MSDSKHIFLDVDSSIVEKNLRFMNDDEDQLVKMFGDGADKYPSKVVKPKPGFCVKTEEIGTGKKLFINICQTDAIPPPKDISEDELLDIIETDSTNFRVPMSIGEVRDGEDKKGQSAKICDIAIHPSFFTKIQNISSFKSFFMAIVFQGLQNKYGLITIDKKVILKNRLTFGTLQKHRIQQREIDEKMGTLTTEKSVIEELKGEKEQTKRVIIETLASVENKTRTPEYRLYRRKSEPNSLIAEFLLPDVLSFKDLTLDVGEDRILLESKARGYLADLFVPFFINNEKCNSTFNKSLRVLTVIMPLKGG